MSTSTLPSKTRSLRKPVDKTKGGLEGDSNETATPATNVFERSSGSPSRLPTVRKATNPSTRPPSSNGTNPGNPSLRPAETRANIGRQVLGGGPNSASTRVGSNSEPVKQDRSRPPVTTSRHLRNVSASTLQSSTRGASHTRNNSSSSLLNPTTSRPPSRTADGEAGTRSSQAEQKRPAFSALQQHFSPAKSLAPKPHPATFLAPPSPSKLPANIAISAETARLQNELLQLHLLHRDAAKVEKEWRASAKRKLGAKFQSVVEQNEKLARLEVEEMGKLNATALKEWQDTGTPGWGLDEKVQVLSEVLTGVWNWGDSGGKYQKLVRKFEKWLVRCQDIRESRERDHALEKNEVEFVEELDDKWKEDCQTMKRKLETWRDQVKNLGVPAEGSSLATVVNGCRNMVYNMLDELSTMAQIEKDAVTLENEWIKCMNNEAMTDEGNTAVAGAAWRLH